MKSKKSLLIGIIILVFILLGESTKNAEKLTTLLLEPTATTTPSKTLGTTDRQTYLVTKVIDGDTIQIEGGQKVRYIGIDTPELKGDECYAKEAKEKNRELVEGKHIRLEKDISETDKYGRLLRFVYTENGIFVNDALIKEGYATVATYPPDVEKQEDFKASQQEARDNNRGLWGSTCKQ